MSNIHDPDDPENDRGCGSCEVQSNLDQVNHILSLHKLANAYLTTLLSRFLDKSEEEASDESRAA